MLVNIPVCLPISLGLLISVKGGYIVGVKVSNLETIVNLKNVGKRPPAITYCGGASIVDWVLVVSQKKPIPTNLL